MATFIPKYLLIGNRIGQIRNKKGLSQLRFAQIIGISRSFLSELEGGVTKPSMPILLAIEYKFDVSYQWIMTGDEPMYRPGSYGLNSIMPVSEDEKLDRAFLFWSGFLKRILKEGNKKDVEAIKASLRALDPHAKKKLLPEEEEDIEKTAM
jgi:transcriptional regulator with XRE-family HTH domain